MKAQHILFVALPVCVGLGLHAQNVTYPNGFPAKGSLVEKVNWVVDDWIRLDDENKRLTAENAKLKAAPQPMTNSNVVYVQDWTPMSYYFSPWAEIAPKKIPIHTQSLPDALRELAGKSLVERPKPTTTGTVVYLPSTLGMTTEWLGPLPVTATVNPIGTNITISEPIPGSRYELGLRSDGTIVWRVAQPQGGGK